MIKLALILGTALALTGCASTTAPTKIITLDNGRACTVPANTPLGLFKGSTDCLANLGTGGGHYLQGYGFVPGAQGNIGVTVIRK